jgi:hypothetical protein
MVGRVGREKSVDVDEVIDAVYCDTALMMTDHSHYRLTAHQWESDHCGTGVRLSIKWAGKDKYCILSSTMPLSTKVTIRYGTNRGQRANANNQHLLNRTVTINSRIGARAVEEALMSLANGLFPRC